MMKKIALLLPLLALTLLVNAQRSQIDDLFDKYYGKEGFTTVLVNQEMLMNIWGLKIVRIERLEE